MITVYSNIKSFERFSKDHLLKNSFFMLINRGLVVTTGFIFWIIAARLFSTDDVGYATTLLSGTLLIVCVSSFGLDISLIRFLKSYDKSKAFYTCLFLIMIASVFFAFLYVCTIPIVSPKLSFIQQPEYALVFITYTVICSIALITSNTFIAMRDAKYSFLQNLLLTTRIPALVPVVLFGCLGIISANLIGYVLTYIVIFTILIKKFISFKPVFDTEFLKMSFDFSFGNYLSNLFYNAAFQLLPLVVLALTTGADAAVFYIALTIGNFLLQVPMALSTSLFVEGVYGENMRKNIIRSGAAMILILVPGIVVFWIFGADILGFFGYQYVSGVNVLRLVALSSLGYAFYSLFLPVLNVRMRANVVAFLNLLVLVLLVGLSYIFINTYGLIGVGYAFLATFAVIDVIILLLSVKWGWLSFGQRTC